MNAINSWIRGCLPSKQTWVGIGQASAVLAMTAIGLRSIPFIKRNTNMLTTIGLGLIGGFGLGLIGGFGVKQIKRYLLKPIETRTALETSLNTWAQGALVGENRLEAVRRILACYENQHESLDLFNLGLNTLPAEIGRLTNLKTLNLDNNQLTTLPSEIGSLTNLKTLNLSENQLTTLPSEIGRLTNLQVLALDCNQFSTLPSEIGRLTNLKTLNLSGNQLSTIPAELKHLTNLTDLYLDRTLVNQVALNPRDIGNIRFLPDDHDHQERQAIIRQVFRAVGENWSGTIQRISQFCDVISAIAAGERENVMNHALQLITPGMFAHDKIEIIRQVAAVPIEERAAYVAERRMNNGMAGGAGAAAEGVNVHAGNRDQKTKEAIELLRKHQGDIAPEDTQRYVREFKEYLYGCERPEQDLAIRALLGPRQVDEHFGPLLDGEIFSVNGLTLTGDEVTSRMWLYASTHPEVKEQNQAKEGMISALADSYEHGSMVCNPGKTQRLAIRVLQGRLAGINIDGLKMITAEQVLTEFFQNETNQKIEKLDELLKAAEAFVNERPAITDELKMQFLKEVRKYAHLQDLG
ncbi:MAG: leucine-rich repeat domain-containing protein [Verrucomicrobiota bacterium]